METKKGTVKIDGISFDTSILNIDDICSLSVEVGTTGYKGGDSGNGCRTIFRVSDNGSSDMRGCVTTKEGEELGSRFADKIKIAFGGDCELDNFVVALDFAFNELAKATGYKNHIHSMESSDIVNELVSRGYQVVEPVVEIPKDNLTDKERTFKSYIIEIIEMYNKENSLSGFTKIRENYKISAISKETFFKACLDEIEDVSVLDTPAGEEFIKSLYVSACKKAKKVKRLSDFE